MDEENRFKLIRNLKGEDDEIETEREREGRNDRRRRVMSSLMMTAREGFIYIERRWPRYGQKNEEEERGKEGGRTEREKGRRRKSDATLHRQ